MSVNDRSSQGSSLPRVSFLDLSRELRDHCYSFALISTDPIIAWLGVTPENAESARAQSVFRMDLREANAFKVATRDVRDTASSLLRCNRLISREASLIFYGKNKFLFAADWKWTAVVTWFEKIGRLNRTFVRSIEVWQHQLSHAWQLASGERVRFLEFDWELLEPPFPRNPYLSRPPDSSSVGVVETINPAIETFFKLVGNKRPEKLSLTFIMRGAFIPGLEVDIDDETFRERWFGMDLPRVVEKLRTVYAPGSVDVTWRGHYYKGWFLQNQTNVEENWKVLDVEEYWARTVRRKVQTIRRMWVTLRMEELPEPLLAEEPAPYSGSGHCSLDGGKTYIRF